MSAPEVEGLVTVHPRMDLRRVRRYARQFAEVLESPELTEDLERILARSRHARTRRRSGSPRRSGQP